MTKIAVFLLLSFFACNGANAIVGGKLSQISDSVALSTVALGNGCTGTLIAEDIVLTAAHCLGRRETQVIFGLSAQDGLRVSVEAQIIHSGFTTTSGGGLSPSSPASRPIHDIALLKLSKPAPQGFLPVQLGSGQDLVSGDQLILAGFGQTSPSRGTSGVLKQVETLFNFYNEDALEVVFGPTPGMSACRGDSGGPMYIEREEELFVIGVTSRGFASLGPCSGSGNYTEVEAHRIWIEETIDELNK